MPQPPRQKFHVVPVRRRDVRRLRKAGPPRGIKLPAKHGDERDRRYPSPHSLREKIGFAIDLVVHVGGAVGVALALTHLPELANYALPVAIGTFLALSIVHRIFVQWACQTTLGKALCGVCLIRDDTGGRPTLWSLVKAWLVGVLVMVGNVSSGL